MRTSDLSREQIDAILVNLKARFPDARIEREREAVRWAQRVIQWSVFLAGLCAGGVLWAVAAALPSEFWRTSGAAIAFVAAMPWYVWVLVLGTASAGLFVVGVSWFLENEQSTREAERVRVMVLFEECAKLGLEMPAQEVIEALRSIPYFLHSRRRDESVT